jgi:hypothetical protein
VTAPQSPENDAIREWQDTREKEAWRALIPACTEAVRDYLPEGATVTPEFIAAQVLDVAFRRLTSGDDGIEYGVRFLVPHKNAAEAVCQPSVEYAAQLAVHAPGLSEVVQRRIAPWEPVIPPGPTTPEETP